VQKEALQTTGKRLLNRAGFFTHDADNRCLQVQARRLSATEQTSIHNPHFNLELPTADLSQARLVVGLDGAFHHQCQADRLNLETEG
jgi:hypothetical protein